MSIAFEHRSTVTGKHWTARQGVYYDCRTVALAQVLPPALYHDFMVIAGACRITKQWGGLNCDSPLESHERDVILRDAIGVHERWLPVDGDVEATIRQAVRDHGYCICRMDAFYHPYFQNHYLKAHMVGHQSTIIDWNESSYYAMDNTGSQTHLMVYDRALFMEAVYASLFNFRDKQDSFSLLEVRTKEQSGDRMEAVVAAISKFIEGRRNLVDDLIAYQEVFAHDVALPASLRRGAQIQNSYRTALQIEVSYTALMEAYRFDATPWRHVLPDADRFMGKLEVVMKGWRTFKMMCKAMEATDMTGSNQAQTVLNRLVGWEKDIREATQ